MPDEAPRAAATLEFAHVLFMDIVGYSQLSMDEQEKQVRALQDFVRSLPGLIDAQGTNRLICLPTGDGMALVFFDDPAAPARCAVYLDQAVRGASPPIHLRIGLHSGPVYRVSDINANRNVAGGGINVAQRVMDCGDAGHILVSPTQAELLGEMGTWKDSLADLGEIAVKHGVTLRLHNLCKEGVGNCAVPTKIRMAKASLAADNVRKKVRTRLVWTFALLLAIAGAGIWILSSHRVQASVGFLLGRGRPSPGTSAAQPGTSSIAVLPFVNMSDDKSQEYFSDGLAEELLNDLAKIPGLRVTARTSSFQFKGKTEDLRTVGEKLNVSTILEGSVRKEGSRVRITTQLIKAGDGFHLWSETYDRELKDVLAVQDEIARSVASSLKVTLLGTDAVAPSGQEKNLDAYNAYLQGRYFFEHRSKENLEKAVGYYERAVKLDAGYALAWAGLSEVRSAQAGAGFIPLEEGYGKARGAAERALALNPNLAEAHASIGGIKRSYDWDWAGADASYQRALALEPGNVTVIWGPARLAAALGRFDEALALDRRALELDPLNTQTHYSHGLHAYYVGRLGEAASACRKTLEINPARPLAHGILGRIYLAQSHPQEALAEMEQEPEEWARLEGLALAYHALGRRKDSDAALSELIGKNATSAAFQIAEVYAFRGEPDQAFKWLDRAYAQRDPGLTLLKGDPLLRSLEHDPRYSAFLNRMRLPV